MRDLTIIVPVYNAVNDAIECIDSILESDASEAIILVVNDGSDGGVQEKLVERFAGLENVKMFENIRNRGYTNTIQFGLELVLTDYVCIINSDTLVPKFWAHRLVAVLESNSAIAGVGPISNAASYQSIPRVHGIGGFSTNSDLGLNLTERLLINEVVLSLFGKGPVVVPILNGFCTIFRVSALTKIGGFDTKNFPMGYGEENDVCARLGSLGFLLVIEPTVFVHHKKSKSFGSERKKLLSKQGRIILDEKYGSELIKDMAAVLAGNETLRFIREFLLCLDLGDSPSIHESPSIQEISGANRGDILVFSGGVLLEISGDHITISEFEAETISLSSNKSEIFIGIPPGEKFFVVKGKVEESALAYAGYLSCYRNIYIQNWEGLPEHLTETGVHRAIPV